MLFINLLIEPFILLFVQDENSFIMKKITIPEPCHENWSNMTPEDKGRHCSVCSKTVIDFTNSEKNEIIDLVENSNENVCGRFNPNQISHSKFPYKRVAAAILAASTIGIQEGNAQEFKKMGEVSVVEEVPQKFEKVTLSGKIKYSNENDASINEALITIFSMGRVIAQGQSSSEGYTIEINGNLIINNHITIQVEKDPLDKKIIENIEVTKEKMTFDIVMKEEYMLMGDVEIQHEEPNPIENCVKGKVKIE